MKKPVVILVRSGRARRRLATVLLALWGMLHLISGAPAAVADADGDSRVTPSRIVSLAPNLTEIIADLGLTATLVGVTRFCDYPPEVSRIPRVGGLIDPDIEKIVRLKPDLVVMLKSQTLRTEKQLRRSGLQVAPYRIETVSDIIATYADLGRRLGVEPLAKNRASAITAAFSPQASLKKAGPKDRQQRIVFIISRPGGAFKNLLTGGAGTYFEDLARATLGELALQTKGYVTVSIEAILKAEPDIIAEVVSDDDSYDPQKRIAEWNRFWSGRHEAPKVIVLKGNKFLRPGPRLVDALAELKSQLRALPAARDAS